MKKHIVPIVLTASMLFASGVLAEEPADTKPITFRGFDWLSSRADVEGALAADHIEDNTIMSNRNAIEWPEGSYDWAGNDHSEISRIENGGWHAMYSGMTTGGYAPSYSYAYQLYPVLANGSLQTSEGDEQLYLGIYEYDQYDFEDLDAVFNDLTAKLSSLYGECSANNDKNFNRNIWTDADGNKAVLISYLSEKYPYVKLAYESGQANDLLGSLQDALDKINESSQESERLANASNTDGL